MIASVCCLRWCPCYNKAIVFGSDEGMENSREYLKRLEALNGGPLRYQSEERSDPAPPPLVTRIERPLSVGEPITFRRDLPRAAMRPVPPPLPTLVLEEAIAGVEITVPGHGAAYHVTTPLETLGGDWPAVRAAFRKAFATPDSPLRSRLATRCGQRRLHPRGCHLRRRGNHRSGAFPALSHWHAGLGR